MLLEDAVKLKGVEPVGPSYTVYRYTDQIYKIVHFHSTKPRVGPVTKRGEARKTDGPPDLHSSLSRARRTILELALCNHWDYFCTFTLDPKYDRFNLKGWYKKFAQFIRDIRKKHGVSLRFVLVPETHKDGAWHIHGLIEGAPPLVSFRDRAVAGEKLPRYLVENNFYSWPDYEKRFGFNSFGSIRNSVACGFYITKYVSKAIDADCLAAGAHRYYASLGLSRSSRHGDIYGYCQYLDRFLVNHYDFCDTGMTSLKDGVDWTFAMDYMEPPSDLEPVDYSEPDETDRIMFEQFFDFIQEKMEGFP